LGLYLAILLFSRLGLWLGYETFPAQTSSLGTLAFFAFTVLHAVFNWGKSRAFVFTVVVFSISMAFELLGAGTGAIFGRYHYGDHLGPKAFGLVPLVMPLAWFMIVYVAFHATDVFRPNRAWQTRPARATGPAWVVALAFLGAMAVTVWDLIMDPQMVALGSWTWEEKGAYFGIPVSNFFGWLLTAFAILVIYRLFVLWRPFPERCSRASWYDNLPLLAYGLTWVDSTIRAAQVGLEGVALVGFFAMGPFVLLAVVQVLRSEGS
ncbi:MAG: carotenoid biosynthesis protein, partial [Chloroflexi bacterium]|nr:carotenoid biosynthesis protein [Chloroflexota bacterium]